LFKPSYAKYHPVPGQVLEYKLQLTAQNLFALQYSSTNSSLFGAAKTGKHESETAVFKMDVPTANENGGQQQQAWS
jgi:hypothetical protein